MQQLLHTSISFRDLYCYTFIYVYIRDSYTESQRDRETERQRGREGERERGRELERWRDQLSGE